MNPDDIIDVEFREKDPSTAANDTPTFDISSNTKSNENYDNQSQYNQTYRSNVKVVKLHPILGLVLFIGLCVLGFIFAGVIAIIVCVIFVIVAIAIGISSLIRKFKK